MGIKIFGDAVFHGNFAKIRKKRPTGPGRFDKEYKAMTPYTMKWREKIGKVECDCVQMLETYMPWYGFSWFHSDECALMLLLKKRPQLNNLPCYQSLPLLAHSEE